MELLKIIVYFALIAGMLYNAFYFAFLMTKNYGARRLAKIKTLAFTFVYLVAVYALSILI
jgi:hypothetical protein